MSAKSTIESDSMILRPSDSGAGLGKEGDRLGLMSAQASSRAYAACRA